MWYHTTRIPESVGLLEVLSEHEGEALILINCFYMQLRFLIRVSLSIFASPKTDGKSLPCGMELNSTGGTKPSELDRTDDFLLRWWMKLPVLPQTRNAWVWAKDLLLIMMWNVIASCGLGRTALKPVQHKSGNTPSLIRTCLCKSILNVAKLCQGFVKYTFCVVELRQTE